MLGVLTDLGELFAKAEPAERRHGLARPINCFTSDQGDRAAELYREGMTLGEVAAAIGSNTRSVTLALEERGVVRRPRGVRVSTSTSHAS